MPLSTLFNRRGIRSVMRSFVRSVFGKRGQRRVYGLRLFYRLRTEVLLRTRHSWEGGINRFRSARLWVDSQAFSRIETLLRRARHTVIIQMFIWKDDATGRRIASILLSLADRGVQVYIFKEALGDVFEFHRDFLSTKGAHHDMWRRFWKHPHIHITYEKRYDHAKVYIIDEKVLLLTGMNIADEYNGLWHDYLVELRGTHFVDEYLAHGASRSPHTDTQLVMNTDQRRDICPAVMGLIEGARRSIVLEHCYVSDPAILDALVRKSRQGVRIVLIVPAHTDLHYYTNMQFVARLIAEGLGRNVEVFLYPRMFHGKIMLVDRERAFVGSANLMASSLDEMGEVNVLLSGGDNRVILKLRDVLRDDILQSQPLTSPPRFHWLWRWLTWLKL